ncbi:transglycosylase SLT domain-containing protein [Streptomyces sp. NBC_00846]|uniref:transglycosylase SLT domain-containing protein n=1 Tax=Streptomyces sp. NBC_00846 TaxID=2975849 RepID=UPI00386933A8|nr:transglycosylase SLT domain-containing protein [Streptomyces sp. NBC_00846]
MSESSIPGRRRRLNKTQKLSAAAISAVAAASLSFSLVPANAEGKPKAQTPEAAAPVVLTSVAGTPQAKALQASLIGQHTTAEKLVKAADLARAKQAAAVEAKAKAAAKVKAAAAAKAEAVAEKRTGTQAASRSEVRTPVYANNLDGWIREALDIMKSRGIPGSYNGLHRNIMRESSGNPNAINGWDINARNGVPSIGLLQIIKPTFDAYHVPGTAFSQYDPVANLTAAANYAADRYGSIDNVNSAY